MMEEITQKEVKSFADELMSAFDIELEIPEEDEEDVE